MPSEEGAQCKAAARNKARDRETRRRDNRLLQRISGGIVIQHAADPLQAAQEVIAKKKAKEAEKRKADTARKTKQNANKLTKRDGRTAKNTAEDAWEGDGR
jgi:hypothetical protein